MKFKEIGNIVLTFQLSDEFSRTIELRGERLASDVDLRPMLPGMNVFSGVMCL